MLSQQGKTFLIVNEKYSLGSGGKHACNSCFNLDIFFDFGKKHIEISPLLRGAVDDDQPAAAFNDPLGD